MRVITGTARGRRLETLSGEDVRPTAERVKEAVFSIIQFDIEGRRFLDLFAGSGQMGIEALSRGAQSAVFTDSAQTSVDIIKKNLSATELMDRARVARTDYASFLKHTSDKFDIAFLDPPYRLGILPDALEMTAQVMSDAGIIICEHPTDIKLAEKVGCFSLQKTYRYGKINISIYRTEV